MKWTLGWESIASQCMDVHANPRTSKFTSIKAWMISTDTHKNMDIFVNIFTDIHCRMFLHGYPCLDINVDIHTFMYNWRLTSENHGYPCWYLRIFGNPCMDMLWTLGPGEVVRFGKIPKLRGIHWLNGRMLCWGCSRQDCSEYLTVIVPRGTDRSVSKKSS